MPMPMHLVFRICVCVCVSAFVCIALHILMPNTHALIIMHTPKINAQFISIGMCRIMLLLLAHNILISIQTCCIQ